MHSIDGNFTKPPELWLKPGAFLGGGHLGQNSSAVESADPIASNSWEYKFCKKIPQNLVKSTHSP